MVAYSFQRRFVAPIQAGRKRHTIRAERKRHARPGEALQLYCGMRTKSCFLVGRSICLSAAPIRLHLKRGIVALTGATLTRPRELDRFAVSDGFGSFDALVGFWDEEHPGIDPFEGVIVGWGELTRPVSSPGMTISKGLRQ